MSEHKHTPGPWHIGVRQAEQIVYDERGWAVANATVYHGYGDRDECRANARLIAAAPDLLNSCGDLVALFEALAIVGTMDGADWNRIHNYCEKARRALAAAGVA